jgi:hypothetical protein
MKKHVTHFSMLLATAAVLSTLGASPANAGEKSDESAMVYELRTYTTLEGRLPALHARFRDHTMQLFGKHGIKNVMYWTPADKKNTLVYLIAHASREAAAKSWKAFGSDLEWKKVRDQSMKDGKILTGVKRQYLTPTDYSPTRSGSFISLVKDEGMVFELRTYTTNDGKLDDLHARFRDHTISLFKKHGMTNLIYTTPTDKKTASNTLVYVIAHNSRAAAKESWKAFITDPEWQKAYRNSIKDGKLVTKVQSQYLNATDYSPSK